MKKSVILLIGIIYVASIVFIGFFGMKVTAYNPTVYVTNVLCINDDASDTGDGYKVIICSYNASLTPEENVYQILWKVMPEESTNKKVNFIYDTNSKVGTVDKLGRVWLKKSGVLTITIQSESNESATDKVRLIVKKVA